MIFTAIHRLDVRDIQWDVAHLFEHLFIRSWHTHLVNCGYSDALFGWMRGETFEGYLFIDAGFYDTEVAHLFDKYISSIPVFDDAQIQAALNDISIEELSVATVNDMSRLRQDLQKLSTRMASRTSADESSYDTSVECITFKTDEGQFCDLALIVAGEDLSKQEQIVFLRWKVLLIDIINHFIMNKYGYYGHGHSDLDMHGRSIGYMSKITIRQDEVAIDDLENYLNASLKKFSVIDNWSQISTHVNAFAHEPLWRNSVIEYFRQTGLVTSVDEIHKFADANCIQSIIAKTTVRVTSYDSANDQWIS